ncbi:MAG TPA: hypothetical protein VLA36_17300 [Longimicrobiales bacterium]|nr:hypothetical protein [Longimicrobiales bacterium]
MRRDSLALPPGGGYPRSPLRFAVVLLVDRLGRLRQWFSPWLMSESKPATEH